MSSPGNRAVCVVGSGWQFTSGISYYTCRLAESLADRSSVSAILMRRLIPHRLYPGAARVGAKGYALDYPASVRVFDGVDWFWVPSLMQAIRFLRRQRPDIVVFQWWTGAVLHTYAVLARVAARQGAKVVVELHESQDTGEARLPGVVRYVRRFRRRLFDRAAAFVVHSDFDRQQLLEAVQVGGRPVLVIPHGPYDHHGGDISGRDAEASAGVLSPADLDPAFVVLFFGTIRPYKGLEYLVEAFDQLDEAEAARLKLLVVGETWEGWTKPIELIGQSRHRDRIQLINRYVDSNEVAAAFAQADAVVLPYVRSSASGPLHIAMAHGLPVVLSDVGGLRYGAAGYEGIRWVPPGDVEALVAALRDLPAERGCRYTDPRSWRHTSEAFDSLFTELDRSSA